MKNLETMQWKVAPQEHDLQNILSEGLNLSPLTAQLLINRGIKDMDAASSFLSPSLKDLHNPFLMKDMDKAVDRIIKAILGMERICVYGDYDADGTTATALLFLFFKEIGAVVEAYIPDRLKEGYGLKKEALKYLHKKGVRLIVTVDCGINCTEEAIYAGELEIDMVITDHHEVPEELPPSCAILNPKQKDCSFPFKGLAGIGVAFKLVTALRANMRDNGLLKDKAVPNLKRYLDLVALGTLGDVVPLVDENRVFVKHGMEELNNGSRAGIRALKDVSKQGSANGKFTSWQVMFQLVPRLNASGRLGANQDAFDLLITDDANIASSLAKSLDRKNSKRQEIEKMVRKDAFAKIRQGPSCETEDIILLTSMDWHPGVIGIVASRIVDTYNRPTVLITFRDGIGKGSARSIKGISIIGLLRECKEFFAAIGGHSQAAGFSMERDRVQDFKTALKKAASTQLSKRDFSREMSLDAIVSLEELSEKVVEEIEGLAPFGSSNPEPLLGLLNGAVIHSKIVGNNHLKLTIRDRECVGNAIGFNLGDSFPAGTSNPGNLTPPQKIEMAFTPSINEWNGRRSVQLKIKDLRNQPAEKERVER
ncbi:MAG: single-stranded-DNA-specific exonuclease RecJ [Thermodesulfobacteriota bacterium]